MENVNPPNLLRHLEKESEVLTQAHQSIKNELTKLQVEEDMLMRTFYNILSAQGLIRRRENMNGLDMFTNQVPEEFPARQIEQNRLQNEVSRSLAIVSAEPENGFMEGRQIEIDNNQPPLLLLPAENQEYAAVEGRHIEIDDNQAPLLLSPAENEDHSWSRGNTI